MADERNMSQIIRKDARNCFVESLSDAFGNGRAHFVFATYDLNKPAGQRQTNNIHIYIAIPELLELCRKLSCGELRYLLQQKKQTGDSKPIQEWLGSTCTAGKSFAVTALVSTHFNCVSVYHPYKFGVDSFGEDVSLFKVGANLIDVD